MFDGWSKLEAYVPDELRGPLHLPQPFPARVAPLDQVRSICVLHSQDVLWSLIISLFAFTPGRTTKVHPPNVCPQSAVVCLKAKDGSCHANERLRLEDRWH
jgi:hypothetical protein